MAAVCFHSGVVAPLLRAAEHLGKPLYPCPSSESAQSEEHNHSFSMLYVSLGETEKLKIEASKFSRSAHVLATRYIFLFPASNLGK